MLRLKNVSKFYYNKGIIASGFSKINIKFELGEFVVITGESGSGKSTLLNVISGLDSYEEGEMYINGCETSHYRESDFEEYRKKYVSNIFQSFNLVNSYTVYQNVELVLLLNGYKKKDIKDRVLSLIDKVGLSRYRKTKVSKLSGGQKQRVAIARALAKETPIIVCDEPTGNLDSKSAREVLKLLKEISKDKLVIMVTHDFPSVENLATRVVQMHDGKILSDKKIKEVEDSSDKIKIKEYKGIGIFNIIRLGIRNTFNIVPKFLLMLIVFLFISASLLMEYGAMLKSEYESSKLGYNYYFSDTTDTRIVINKKDGSSISNDDFEVISKLENIDNIYEHDILLDSFVWFETTDYKYSFYGYLRGIDKLEYKLDYGRMPEDDNEVVVVANSIDYYFAYELDSMLDSKFYLNGDATSLEVKIVGVVFVDDYFIYDSYIYGNEEFLNNYIGIINKESTTGTIKINDKKYPLYNSYGTMYSIKPSDKLSSGYAYVISDMNYLCKNGNCKNQNISIEISSLYYNDSISLKVKNVYDDKNVKRLLGIDKNNLLYGTTFVSYEDYNKLFNKDSYQASVFSNHVDNVDSLSEDLEKLGYNTLQIRKTLNNEGSDTAKIIKIFKVVVSVVLIVALFFISYFVIKLILKSRQVYFSTLRILGAASGHIKRILDIELFVNATISYILFLGFILLVRMDYIQLKMVLEISNYLKFGHYVLMYVILVCMSYLISTRFAKKIFKKSAMKTYREEV